MTCACAFPVFMAVGCSGNDGGEDEPAEKKVTLTPSKESIVANGADRVTFTVMWGEENVSSRAKIQVVDPDGKQTLLDAPSFMTATAGDYTFTAEYESRSSERVLITAKAAEPEKYFRRVCIMDATGTWCTNCPNASRSLLVLQNNRPDRLIVLGVHGPTLDQDPMTTPVIDMLDKIHKVTGYPMAVVDLREATTGLISDGVGKGYNTSRKQYPATCGLRLESGYDTATGKLDITVGVTSNTGGEYRLAVFVVEDGIIARQLDGGLYNDDYKHNDVVRKLLSGNLLGDALGTLEPDVEVTKTYSTEVDAAWKVDNLRIVAYATDATGYINNVVECEAKEGSCDYKLNE